MLLFKKREHTKKALSVFFFNLILNSEDLTILIAEDTISQKHDMLYRTQVTTTKNGFSFIERNGKGW